MNTQRPHFMSDLSQYNVEDATHLLQCRHSMNRHQHRDYTMKCIVLGKTKKGKTKIVVFGDRFWKDTDHVKRIRYVYAWRLKPLKAKIKHDARNQ